METRTLTPGTTRGTRTFLSVWDCAACGTPSVWCSPAPCVCRPTETCCVVCRRDAGTAPAVAPVYSASRLRDQSHVPMVTGQGQGSATGVTVLDQSHAPMVTGPGQGSATGVTVLDQSHAPMVTGPGQVSATGVTVFDQSHAPMVTGPGQVSATGVTVLIKATPPW